MVHFAQAQLCHVLLLTCVRKDYTTIVERARALADTPNTFLNVQGLGPTAALSRLRDNLPDNLAHRESFWAEARTAAITGSSAKTKDSLRSGSSIRLRVCACGFLHSASGINSWLAFSVIRYGTEVFPPNLNGLLEWSHTFRCVGTFANYLGYVRTASLALDVPYVDATHPALHKAKAAVLKRMMFTSRCFSYTIECKHSC